MKAYLLKIRGGVEVDSAGKKAGKGPLVQEEVSATLGVSQDQYLFQPVVYENHSQDSRYRDMGDINETVAAKYGTGGNNQPLVVFSKSRRAQSKDDFETWKESKVSNTLNTFDQGDVRTNEIVVYGISAYDSNAMKSPNPHSGIYKADTTRTLDINGGNPACQQGGMIVIEGGLHFMEAYQHHGWRDSEKAGTLTAAQNDHVRGDTPLVIEGGGTSESDRASDGELASGELHRTGRIQRHVGCYATGNGQVDNMTISDKVGALDCMHDQKIVILNDQGGERMDVTKDKTCTLRAEAHHPPVVVLDRAAFNQGENAQYEPYISGGYRRQSSPRDRTQYVIGSLQARDYKGIGKQYVEERKVVIQEMEGEYIVRRLTPLECCRLQGFPDGWAEIDPKGEFTDEEYEFWKEVRKTHAEINGKKVMDWSRENMLNWYNKLHTDSAEYKMWGNGIALPNALFVMRRIKEVEDEIQRTRRRKNIQMQG